MRPCIEHSQAWSANLPDHILNRDEIPERLVHLLPLDTQQARVKPITRQRLLPRQTLRLRDLGLMMRKDEIRTTTMNIIRWPNIRQRNRSILDMPSRPPLSPRTIPEYLARFLALPQSKVSRMLLARIRVNSVNRQVL